MANGPVLHLRPQSSDPGGSRSPSPGFYEHFEGYGVPKGHRVDSSEPDCSLSLLVIDSNCYLSRSFDRQRRFIGRNVMEALPYSVEKL